MRKVVFGSAFSLFPRLAILWPSFLLLFLLPLIARHLLSGLGGDEQERIGGKAAVLQEKGRGKGKDRTTQSTKPELKYLLLHLNVHICHQV